MNQRGFIVPQLYLIAGLAIISGVTGYALYKSIQSNGVLRANNAQLEQSLVDANAAYQQLESERRRTDFIVLDNLELKQTIEKEVVRYRDRIKEVVRNAPPENCINQPAPADLICLLRENCSN